MLIDYLSVPVAAAAAFVVGGIWYGPLFGKAWMRAFNMNEADIAGMSKGRMAALYGAAFVLTMVPAAALEFLLVAAGDPLFGALNGLGFALGFIAPFTVIQYLFEGRPAAAFFINAGYSVVAMTIMGAVIGAW